MPSRVSVPSQRSTNRKGKTGREYTNGQTGIGWRTRNLPGHPCSLCNGQVCFSPFRQKATPPWLPSQWSPPRVFLLIRDLPKESGFVHLLGSWQEQTASNILLETFFENNHQYSVFRICYMLLAEGPLSHSAVCFLHASLHSSLRPHLSPKATLGHWGPNRPSQPPPAKVSKSFDRESKKRKVKVLFHCF